MEPALAPRTASLEASLQYQYPRNTRRPRKYKSTYGHESCETATNPPATHPAKSKAASSRQLRKRKQIDYCESSGSDTSESPKKRRGSTESCLQEPRHYPAPTPTSTSGSATHDITASDPISVLPDPLTADWSTLDFFDIGLSNHIIRVNDGSAFKRRAYFWDPLHHSLPLESDLKEERDCEFHAVELESGFELLAPENLENLFKSIDTGTFPDIRELLLQSPKPTKTLESLERDFEQLDFQEPLPQPPTPTKLKRRNIRRKGIYPQTLVEVAPPTGKMAPSYRNPNRRQNRQGVDHDVLEGMPVRHWRRDFVTIAPPPTHDSTNSQNDIWAVELPYGMPKDSHLLPQHSQDLLRAARSGKIYKRPAPADEEEAEPEAIIGDKPEKKDDDLKDKGFTAKSWKQIPRHLEGPDVEYLAKRRKNLVTASSKPSVPVPTVTKATVKRIDAAGNEYVQDIVVPQGQKVEGEVLSQTVIPDPSAPVDLTAVQATPPRRRPTSKKKAKGPGRGRKKKPAAPTSAPQIAHVEGAAPVPAAEGVVGPDGVKIENETMSTPTNNEDTEMGDGSQANTDDEEGEDGDEGDDGDDDEGSVDVQDSPSKQPDQPSPSGISAPFIPPIPPLDPVDTAMSGTEFSQAPPKLPTDRFEGKAGSPLKHVVLTTSALTSPLASPSVPTPPSSFQDIAPTASPVPTPQEPALETLKEEIKQETAELTPPILPPPPPEPTTEQVVAAVEERQEEEEEEEMLLDIVDNANHAQIGAPLEPIPELVRLSSRSPPVLTPNAQQGEPEVTQPQTEPELIPEPVQEEVIPLHEQEAEIPTERVNELEPVPVQESVPEEPKQDAPKHEAPKHEDPVEDDEDDYPDLLGSLEKSLKTPEARVETPAAVPVAEKTPEIEMKAAREEATEGEDENQKEEEPKSQESEMLL